jgi:hypothetical protein
MEAMTPRCWFLHTILKQNDPKGMSPRLVQARKRQDTPKTFYSTRK